MKNVNNFVVKTLTSESSGYIVKTVSTTTAGPGGCVVVIHTEEEKRLVSVKDREDYLVPELPPTVIHVPIFPSAIPAFGPITTEASTNTECNSISCCTQTSGGPDNPPNPGCRPQPQEPTPGCTPQPQQPAPGCTPQPQEPSPGCTPQPQQPTPGCTPQQPAQHSHPLAKVPRSTTSREKLRDAAPRPGENSRAAESSTESDSEYSYSSESESSACWCETTYDTISRLP
ncbi:balbiani ring protein 1-like isoform X1 [Homalodisca vitripennis]|uniref:balbiani ring protein 1-like isoform X1 n=1 Tax=Homalodisca vitripennis TaxID=197043 RepID=UPI001EEA84DA|nr:balbiani ring protein 1-like isoform X1 [Homalodisca vitripennis]